jgi:hypothetical protein
MIVRNSWKFIRMGTIYYDMHEIVNQILDKRLL